ncbi:unnamed protein product [Mycena citricolor]|uniref:GATA-type domain-containing protein n=1 Tax=Mycena citricolor TaxID=2018698 RepID=A0AAD2H2T1_9AGAR|nr:unnamed protein product [Mycena citricolor]
MSASRYSLPQPPNDFRLPSLKSLNFEYQRDQEISNATTIPTSAPTIPHNASRQQEVGRGRLAGHAQGGGHVQWTSRPPQHQLGPSTQQPSPPPNDVNRRVVNPHPQAHQGPYSARPPIHESASSPSGSGSGSNYGAVPVSVPQHVPPTHPSHSQQPQRTTHPSANGKRTSKSGRSSQQTQQPYPPSSSSSSPFYTQQQQQQQQPSQPVYQGPPPTHSYPVHYPPALHGSAEPPPSHVHHPQPAPVPHHSHSRQSTSTAYPHSQPAPPPAHHHQQVHNPYPSPGPGPPPPPPPPAQDWDERQYHQQLQQNQSQQRYAAPSPLSHYPPSQQQQQQQQQQQAPPPPQAQYMMQDQRLRTRTSSQSRSSLHGATTPVSNLYVPPQPAHSLSQPPQGPPASSSSLSGAQAHSYPPPYTHASHPPTPPTQQQQTHSSSPLLLYPHQSHSQSLSHPPPAPPPSASPPSSFSETHGPPQYSHSSSLSGYASQRHSRPTEQRPAPSQRSSSVTSAPAVSPVALTHHRQPSGPRQPQPQPQPQPHQVHHHRPSQPTPPAPPPVDVAQSQQNFASVSPVMSNRPPRRPTPVTAPHVLTPASARTPTSATFESYRSNPPPQTTAGMGSIAPRDLYVNASMAEKQHAAHSRGLSHLQHPPPPSLPPLVTQPSPVQLAPPIQHPPPPPPPLAQPIPSPQEAPPPPNPKASFMNGIVEHCTVLYQFASHWAQAQAQDPNVQPSQQEVAAMAGRAAEVVRLLEEVRKLTAESAAADSMRGRATPMDVDSAGPNDHGRGPKRTWAEMQGAEDGEDELEEDSEPQPYPTPTESKTSPPVQSGNSVFDSNPHNESPEAQTTAEYDMELIRVKRAATGGTVGPMGPTAKNKYRKRSRATPPGKCHSCQIQETPEWRRGPDGARTLCNACGLHYAKMLRKREKEHQAAGNNGEVPKIDMEALRASAKADLAEKSARKSAQQSQTPAEKTQMPAPSHSHHEGTFQVTFSTIGPADVQAQLNGRANGSVKAEQAGPPPGPAAAAAPMMTTTTTSWATARNYTPDQQPSFIRANASPR